MPLVIPEEIPAFSLLKQHAFIMGSKRAKTQDIRTLEVLIFNLMPTKIQTENQILSLLANSPLQVNITLLTTASYAGKNTPKSHLDRFYVSFDAIKDRKFDGAIVTGAPIEHLEFEEVKYWRELIEIMEFLKTHCTSTLYLCWGAMAGLYHFHKIQKIALNAKLSGIFEHFWVEQDLILNGLDELVRIPHSRHSGIDETQVRANPHLKILLEGKESGVSALKDEKDFFILGHPEYSKDTLDLEYKRDLEKGLEIAKPKNYYNTQSEPIFSWRSSASVLFANWLNFCVYQDTPFILQ
ncbi:homoserine O-succinyltransferase [Helicobacter sp.]|uniref:homoserine O-succinyltransferase n=1 Tax=Helicobacter sp. TaxID=218 RepID=UPI0025C706B0|nr:homoserine O-succinyltransferase [Helicobacter sp.]MCI5969340.1 homoserine O-succinyltransferase [Helicobacter sp.]MDY2585594.1 homoserine O-succinyltransferase [Helicobacter sp.]